MTCAAGCGNAYSYDDSYTEAGKLVLRFIKTMETVLNRDIGIGAQNG